MTKMKKSLETIVKQMQNTWTIVKTGNGICYKTGYENDLVVLFISDVWLDIGNTKSYFYWLVILRKNI